MKILLVHNIYKTKSIGGEDLVFENEKEALIEVLGKENVFEYNVKNDEANILDFALNIFYSRKYYKEIYKIVTENKINIVHVHNFFPLLSVSIFKAAKDAGAKVVNTLHNYRFWCINGMLYRDKKGICHDCINKNVYSGVKHKCYRNSYLQSLVSTLAFGFYKLIKFDNYIDIYFVLTEFQQKKVVELGLRTKKIILKPNFVKGKQQKPSYSKEDFIFVGRLEPSKGIIQLIDVWRTLGEEYWLKIIGAGPLQNHIENLGIKNIQYLGKKNNDETIEEISNSRFLLQTSLWYETFGLTIVEAFSVGTPVIGLNTGTRMNFIKDNYNGYLCSLDELRGTIIKANTSNNYDYLYTNSLNSFKNYSKDTVVIQQIELYKKIINGEI